MNWYKVTGVMIYNYFLCGVLSFGQASFQENIPSFHITVSFYKTTNLLFPYPIKVVDRGHKDLLAQIAKGADTILQLKAGRENFTETSLSVVTAEGKLYPFIVKYAKDPEWLSIRFKKDSLMAGSGAGVESTRSLSGPLLQQTAAMVEGKKRMLAGIRNKSYGMKLQLDGIYIDNNVLYFQLNILNSSPLQYDIALLHFYIKDKTQANRTASQELEQTPLYASGVDCPVKGNSTRPMVVALPKFTIPDKKRLHIQLLEKNGGRHLHLVVRNRTIVKARPVITKK